MNVLHLLLFYLLLIYLFLESEVHLWQLLESVSDQYQFGSNSIPVAASILPSFYSRSDPIQCNFSEVHANLVDQ